MLLKKSSNLSKQFRLTTLASQSVEQFLIGQEIQKLKFSQLLAGSSQYSSRAFKSETPLLSGNLNESKLILRPKALGVSYFDAPATSVLLANAACMLVYLMDCN